MNSRSSVSDNTKVWWCLGLFLLMEIPVRLWLQPDPWLLKPTHWYFMQPMRFFLELGLIVFLVAVIRTMLPQLFVSPRKHLDFLVIGSIGSIVLFGFLEYEQLKASLSVEASYWALWFFTGFCIGVGQELTFRGLLFTSLAKRMNKNLAGLITTIIFVIAPLHSVRMFDLYAGGHLGVVLLLVAIYFAAGFLFQWLRERTGGVIVPGVVHGFGNAITWVAVFS